VIPVAGAKSEAFQRRGRELLLRKKDVILNNARERRCARRARRKIRGVVVAGSSAEVRVWQVRCNLPRDELLAVVRVHVGLASYARSLQILLHAQIIACEALVASIPASNPVIPRDVASRVHGVEHGYARAVPPPARVCHLRRKYERRVRL